MILDADIDSDVDDVAALAMLHHLASKNQIELLAVIVTSDDPFAPPEIISLPISQPQNTTSFVQFATQNTVEPGSGL